MKNHIRRELRKIGKGRCQRVYIEERKGGVTRIRFYNLTAQTTASVDSLIQEIKAVMDWSGMDYTMPAFEPYGCFSVNGTKEGRFRNADSIGFRAW